MLIGISPLISPELLAVLHRMGHGVGFVQTVKAGNKMTPLIRVINNLGTWLSDRIA